YFLEYYPELILARYKLKQLPEDDISLLEEIGRRRGALRPGGHIDIHKASELLISEFRNGTIGRISLETPELIAAKKAMLSRVES
ncbi:MAG: ribosome biogenesis GTPase YlqF, partial [Gammaproteobacteria bacterium]|nr:ribosome biogenesis GTPase YlqF [Gammaproteobacteria bacterium]